MSLTNIVPQVGPTPVRHAGLGIRRTGHIAISTAAPADAAAFAVDHLGFSLAGSDDAGCHYLAAAGQDHYSLAYLPGDEEIAHISYLVDDVAALDGAATALAQAGVATERLDPVPPWRPEPVVRFRTPAGHPIELTVGVGVGTTMAAVTDRPQRAPGPITCDHVVVRCVDVDGEIAFAGGPLGLLESSRIVAPDVGPVLTFFRARTLYHCLAVARSGTDGLHHMQFTLKDGAAVFEAWERMRDDPAVDVVWDPVRHGPGHNIAFYFRDYAGNFVEYSAEEEIILGDEHYAPMIWSALDQRSMDEWGTQPPEAFLG